MLIVTAGQTSDPIQAQAETDDVILSPANATTMSIGYVEISYDGVSWRKWAADNVIAETRIKAGVGRPWFRAVCIKGVMNFYVNKRTFNDSDDVIDMLNASALTPPQVIDVLKKGGGIDISPSYSAANNTAAIQAALDEAHAGTTSGIVTIDTPGIIIHNGLVIGDNTHLIVGPMTTLKLANNVNVNPICNKAYKSFNLSGVKPSISSLTSSGLICTATATSAHGLSAGDFVSISGSTTSGYGGTHEVLSVADATHFTYRAALKPANTTAAGTITFCKANRNIRISVYGWNDCNGANNGTASGGLAGCGIMLGHVFDYHIDNLNTTGCTTRTVMTFNCTKARIENIFYSKSLVGIQTCGAMIDFRVRNVSAFDSTDDGIAIMNREAAAFPALQVSEGDMIGIQVDTVDIGGNGGGGSRPIAIYSTSMAYYYSVKVRNVFGSRVPGTSLRSIAIEGDLGATTAGRFDEIEIENVNHACNQAISTEYANIKTLRIKNVDVLTSTGAFTGTSSVGYINFSGTSVIARVFIEGVRCEQVTAPGSIGGVIVDNGAVTDEVNISGSYTHVGVTAIYLRNSGILKKLNFRDCSAANGQLFFQNSGTVTEVNHFSSRSYQSSTPCVYNGLVSTTNLFGVLTNFTSGGFVSFAAANTYNVNIFGGDCSGNDAGAGLLYINNASAVVNVTAEGVNYGANATTLKFNANGTVNPRSFGVLCDATSARISKTLGNRCTHTGASNPGPAIADGSNFYCQAMGAALPGLCA